MKNWKIRSILVPFDFLPPSVAALSAAKEAAARWEAQIELLHVLAYPAVFVSGEMGLGDPLLDKGPSVRDVEKNLRKAAGDYPKLRLHVLEGDPEELIRRLGEDAAADLVVMGTHGYTGLDHLIMRSVVETVVREAAVPVLSLHADSKGFSPKRILVPVNFTDHAGDALAHACLLAREYKADLHLLHISEVWGSPVNVPDNIRRHLERTAAEIKGVRATCEVKSGDAVDEILRTASDGGFDLVVLSAHRRYVWKEWMVGTTAERVLRHSPVPVLAVPSETQALLKRARKVKGRSRATPKIVGIR